MMGTNTESGEKEGVSVQCIVYSDVHDGHIKLQTINNVQSVKQGFNNGWNT